MENAIHLKVSDELINGKIRRITTLSGGANVEMFHEFEASGLQSEPLLDGSVLAVLLYCMSLGKQLIVHGALSKSMTRNLEEIQLIWSRWKPQIYSKIEIVPLTVVDARWSGKERAIAAFSGGADATFTALRHSKKPNEDIRYPVTDVLMVHGFDVELKNSHFFKTLQERVSPLLGELGLNLRTIKTNSKNLNLQNWEDSFSLELAACLHMFSGEFQYGLIGSSEPYEALILPWGSTPITDHLMSGDAFEIIHDGAGFSRTDKIAEIALNPAACKTLKVCWIGEDQSDNCGRCEKCVRTMLNFLAAGSPIPPCFPNGLDMADLKNMKINNVAQMAELIGIVNYAKRKGAQGAWMKPLQERIAAGVSRAPFSIKQMAKTTLIYFGLEAPARRLVKRIRA